MSDPQRSVRHPNWDRLVSVPPINPEVAIQREHFRRAMHLGKTNKTGIGQGHRAVPIAPHQCAHIRLLFLDSEADADRPPLQQGKQRIAIAALSLQEKRRFCENRLARKQGRA
jgi:hypothetical protein